MRFSARALIGLIAATGTMFAGSAAASASSGTLPTPASTQYSTVTSGLAPAMAYEGGKGCQKTPEFLFRTESGDRWKNPTVVEHKCSGDAFSQPQLVRDTANGRYFVVWSESSLTSPARSGVWYSYSVSGGRRWSGPELLERTPHVASPVLFSATAYDRTLWLAAEDPSSGAQQSKFTIIGYGELNHTESVTNRARGRGRFMANTIGTSALLLDSASAGLYATWQITDAGGQTRTYSADLSGSRPARVKLHYNGSQTYPAVHMTYTVGRDRVLYRLYEVEERNLIPPIDLLYVQSYNFRKHAFEYLNSAKPLAIINEEVVNNITLPYAGFAISADPRHNVYVSYADFPPVAPADAATDSCLTETGTPCVRTTDPAQPSPSLFVLSLSHSGQLSRAIVPWPFDAAGRPGDTLVQWLQPGDDTIFIDRAGVHLIDRFGWQDMTRSGGVPIVGTYDMVLTPGIAPFAAYTPSLSSVPAS